MDNIRVLPAGDSAITIEFGKEISPAINRRISATVQMLREQHVVGVIDMIPTYCTLLINYDPRVILYDDLKNRIESLLKQDIDAGASKKKIYEIPVCYGGEYGPIWRPLWKIPVYPRKKSSKSTAPRTI